MGPLQGHAPPGPERGGPEPDPADQRWRLLIFVIAYYAESTLRRVLERIPRSVFDQYDCEVLVVDDGSKDRTFAIGHEYKQLQPEVRMTVLRNEYNQGYGGNQKVGYSYAISEGFDFVAMLHGDGQYAPEELPRLIEPLCDGETAAVFGSRMLSRLDALRGGMPLYKYAGNRILTFLQNLLLGSRLSEFHSGYRIYSVSWLNRIPYRLNSNDFHFDTEIIIQLLNSRGRIVELPIPTYYGDEICRVNGMKYAKDVLKATALNALHRAGLFYQRRFDPALEESPHYNLKLGFPSSHSYALGALPAGASVIDIGSEPGDLARELRAKGCDVAVVETTVRTTIEAVDVFVQDLDEELRFDVGRYQYILMLDIIEHLRDPELFLARLRKQFTHEPKILILTTPNVAFLPVRIMLLLGQFNYGRAGILDQTHRRLLTFRSAALLLRDAGFRIRRLRGIPAPFPKALGQGWAARLAMAANLVLIALSKTLFSYQIYVEAESTPDVDFVLRDTKEKSAHRRARLREGDPEEPT